MTRALHVFAGLLVLTAAAVAFTGTERQVSRMTLGASPFDGLNTEDSQLVWFGVFADAASASPLDIRVWLGTQRGEVHLEAEIEPDSLTSFATVVLSTRASNCPAEDLTCMVAELDSLSLMAPAMLEESTSRRDASLLIVATAAVVASSARLRRP